MNQPAFSTAVDAALRGYTVPPLPTGFAQRLIERLERGDLPVEPLATPVPQRPRRSSPWLRGGRLLGSTALFGLVTVAAAATGMFGEPVYVPGVSEMLAKAEVVAIPKPKALLRKPADTRAATLAPPPVEPEPATAPPATGSDAVRTKFAELRSDPEYRALPRAERRAIARAEAARLIRSGAVTAPELRQTLREVRHERQAAIAERIDAVREARRTQRAVASPLESAPATRIAAPPVAEPEAPAPPERVAISETPAAVARPAATPERIRAADIVDRPRLRERQRRRIRTDTAETPPPRRRERIPRP